MQCHDDGGPWNPIVAWQLKRQSSQPKFLLLRVVAILSEIVVKMSEI